MPTEIERKFLVDHQRWAAAQKPSGIRMEQGYLSDHPARAVRVRLSGTEAYLTIKGISTGASRSEFEYPIPVEHAVTMLRDLCPKVLSKTRYKVTCNQKIWDVDVFHGALEGLIVAEIELNDESESFDLPDWVTEEVTDDPAYYNVRLIERV